MAIYKIGDLVTFTYNSPRSHDKFPKVLVLHDGYVGPSLHGRTYREPRMHGLNFNYLSNDEINYLRMVLNKTFREKEFDAFYKKNPQMAEKLKQTEHIYDSLNINSPKDFYVRFIRQFIKPKGWEPYRLYDPNKMQSPRILRKREYFTSNNPLSVLSRYIDKVRYRKGNRFF